MNDAIQLSAIAAPAEGGWTPICYVGEFEGERGSFAISTQTVQSWIKNLAAVTGQPRIAIDYSHALDNSAADPRSQIATRDDAALCGLRAERAGGRADRGGVRGDCGSSHRGARPARRRSWTSRRSRSTPSRIDVYAAGSSVAGGGLALATTNGSGNLGGYRAPVGMPLVVPASELYFWTAKWRAQERALSRLGLRGRCLSPPRWMRSSTTSCALTKTTAEQAQGAPRTSGPGLRSRFQEKPPAMQAVILRCLKRLEEGDRSRGLRVKKMRGYGNVWEARVDHANRVTFERDGDTLYLRANCNHDVLWNP